MLIHSDWHIHSEFSHDATLPLKEIAETAANFSFRRVGITDHVNFNNNKFSEDLKQSANHVKEVQKNIPTWCSA